MPLQADKNDDEDEIRTVLSKHRLSIYEITVPSYMCLQS